MRQKVIVSTRKHEPKIIPHDCFYLHVEVPEHLIVMPAANQLHDVAIKSRSEEVHGTNDAEGAVRQGYVFES